MYPRAFDGRQNPDKFVYSDPIFNYRICESCWDYYWYTNRLGLAGGAAGDADVKLCSACEERVIRRQERLHDAPIEVVSLRRLVLSGKRILSREYEKCQIEIIKQISKTKSHESHSIAQAIVSHPYWAKKWNH